MLRLRRIRLAFTSALGLTLACSPLVAAKRPKAAAVAGQTLRISTAQGSALEPFIISLDWSKPLPQITRAVIIFRGKGRDVEFRVRGSTLSGSGNRCGYPPWARAQKGAPLSVK